MLEKARGSAGGKWEGLPDSQTVDAQPPAMTTGALDKRFFELVSSKAGDDGQTYHAYRAIGYPMILFSEVTGAALASLHLRCQDTSTQRDDDGTRGRAIIAPLHPPSSLPKATKSPASSSTTKSPSGSATGSVSASCSATGSASGSVTGSVSGSDSGSASGSVSGGTSIGAGTVDGVAGGVAAMEDDGKAVSDQKAKSSDPKKPDHKVDSKADGKGNGMGAGVMDVGGGGGGGVPRFQGLVDRDDQEIELVITNLSRDGMINFNLMRTGGSVREVNPGGVNEINELRPGETYVVQCDQNAGNRPLKLCAIKNVKGEASISVREDLETAAAEAARTKQPPKTQGTELFLSVAPESVDSAKRLAPHTVPAIIRLGQAFVKTVWRCPPSGLFVVVEPTKQPDEPKRPSRGDWRLDAFDEGAIHPESFTFFGRRGGGEAQATHPVAEPAAGAGPVARSLGAAGADSSSWRAAALRREQEEAAIRAAFEDAPATKGGNAAVPVAAASFSLGAPAQPASAFFAASGSTAPQLPGSRGIARPAPAATRSSGGFGMRSAGGGGAGPARVTRSSGGFGMASSAGFGMTTRSAGRGAGQAKGAAAPMVKKKKSLKAKGATRSWSPDDDDGLEEDDESSVGDDVAPAAKSAGRSSAGDREDDGDDAPPAAKSAGHGSSAGHRGGRGGRGGGGGGGRVTMDMIMDSKSARLEHGDRTLEVNTAQTGKDYAYELVSPPCTLGLSVSLALLWTPAASRMSGAQLTTAAAELITVFEQHKYADFLAHRTFPSDQCVICLEDGPDVATFGCGHVCMHRKCSEKITTCPLSRAEISARLQAIPAQPPLVQPSPSPV